MDSYDHGALFCAMSNILQLIKKPNLEFFDPRLTLFL